jgi:hypothetical protein
MERSIMTRKGERMAESKSTERDISGEVERVRSLLRVHGGRIMHPGSEWPDSGLSPESAGGIKRFLDE